MPAVFSPKKSNALNRGANAPRSCFLFAGLQVEIKHVFLFVFNDRFQISRIEIRCFGRHQFNVLLLLNEFSIQSCIGKESSIIFSEFLQKRGKSFTSTPRKRKIYRFSAHKHEKTLQFFLFMLK